MYAIGSSSAACWEAASDFLEEEAEAVALDEEARLEAESTLNFEGGGGIGIVLPVAVAVGAIAVLCCGGALDEVEAGREQNPGKMFASRFNFALT